MISLLVIGGGPAFGKPIDEYSPYQDRPQKPATPVPDVFKPSPVVLPAAAEEPPKTVVAKLPEAYAEPISPATVERFRHLKPYQGQLLIGGSNVQMVIAGVPAKEPEPGWQPVVLAIFAREDGVFVKSAALDTLELRVPVGDVQLYPLGVDLGMEKAAKLAFITQVYGTSGGQGSRQTMTWQFDAETETLAVGIGEFAAPPNFAAKTPIRWQMRLTGPEATTLAGDGYWVRASDADVLTFLPYRQVTAKSTPEGVEFDNASGEAPPLEGFELLLGRHASGRTLTRALSLKDCLYGTQRPRKPLKEEARLPWILACQASSLTSTLRLTVAAGEGPTSLKPLYLFAGDGTPLLYSALRGERDTVDVLLPVEQGATFQLADTLAGRLVPGTSSIVPVSGQLLPVEIPAESSGLVRILPGTSTAAAILTLRRLDRSGGTDAAIWGAGDGDSQRHLAANRLLIQAWPADLELESGGYELAVSRGDDGQFCKTQVWVQKDRRVLVACGQDAVNKKSKPTTPFTYVDLASADGRDLPLLSLRQALGVDLLAEPVAESEGHASPLKVLRTEDKTTGISLSFTPATTALAERWEKQIASRTHEDPTTKFRRLVRGEGGLGILELGCPGPGTSAFDYELLVKKVQPDAVRLFGCKSHGLEDDWLRLYDRLAASRQTPLLLTNETGLKMPLARAPRLLLHVDLKSALANPESAIAALVAGDYSISTGADVVLTKVTQSSKTNLVADVSYAALAATPTVLTIYSDKGLLKKTKIPVDAAGQGVLSVPLHKAGINWLRAELRDDAGILATTNAVPVSRLLQKEKDSH